MDFRGFFRQFTQPRVQIFADFIDPFCYIGFHNLRQAAEAEGIGVEWHGFELNPQTPPEGFDVVTAGNSDLRPGMWASVAEYARRAGLIFPEPQHVPNTRLAHQLVLGAGKADVKNPLIERIYQAYFNSQMDIGHFDVLIQLASEFGIAKPAAERALKETGAAQRLEAHRQEAIRHHFPGMPGFLLNGKILFGALSQDAWKKETLCSTR